MAGPPWRIGPEHAPGAPRLPGAFVPGTAENSASRRGYARPTFASVGVWKYWLSSENWSMSRFSSAMRPSAVLMGRHSSQLGSPQGCRE
jgi:hypothetical protein